MDKIIVTDADFDRMQNDINKIDDKATRERLQKKLDEMKANAEYLGSTKKGDSDYGNN